MCGKWQWTKVELTGLFTTVFVPAFCYLRFFEMKKLITREGGNRGRSWGRLGWRGGVG